MARPQHAGAGNVAHARELPPEPLDQHLLLPEDLVHPECDAIGTQPEHDRLRVVMRLALSGAAAPARR